MNRRQRLNSGFKPVCEECGSEKWEWNRRDWVCPDCTKIIPTGRGDVLDRPIDFRPMIIPMKQAARKAA